MVNSTRWIRIPLAAAALLLVLAAACRQPAGDSVQEQFIEQIVDLRIRIEVLEADIAHLRGALGSLEPLDRPSNLRTSNGGHTVIIQWWGPARADSFLVHYRSMGDPAWQEKIAEREIVYLSELDPSHRYEVRVASQRSGMADSEFSPVFVFRPPDWK